MSELETSAATRTTRVAAATAVVVAGGALACGVCCVLPFALPAAALALSGGALAWLGGLYSWMAGIAVVAVLASWAWIGWTSLNSRKRPARSTWICMVGATFVLAAALAWPHLEGVVVGLVRP